jgi:hypothetical protein
MTIKVAEEQGAPLMVLGADDVAYLAQVAQDNDWEEVEHMAIDALQMKR